MANHIHPHSNSSAQQAPTAVQEHARAGTEAHGSEPQGGGRLDNLSFYAVLALAFLLPWFFVPSVHYPFLMTKVLLGGAGALVALVLFVVQALRAQELRTPRTLLLPLAWAVPFAYLLSTLFQDKPSVSFFGETLGIDSLAFMLSGAVLLTVTALSLVTRERILSVYLALLSGAGVVALLQFIVFFWRSLPEALGLVVPVPSVVGSLNDLALFSGLVTVLALVSLAVLTLTRTTRVVVWAALVLSLFFLMVVNLKLLWWVVGVFALSMFVYSMYRQFVRNEQTGRGIAKLSFASLATLAIALVMLFGSVGLTGKPAAWAGVGELDVRPSWSATLTIARSVLADNPLFGSGPGTFAQVWSENRPLEVNETVFWNADFTAAIGLVPTSVISTGAVGLIAWLAFLVWLVVVGFRAFVLSKEQPDPLTHYLRISAWTGSVYLWLVAVIAAPSGALMAYAFLMTGVFLASMGVGNGTIRFAFKSSPRLGFVATLVLTVACIGAVAGGVGYTTRYLAEASFQEGVLKVSATANLDEAEERIAQAIVYNDVDVYQRLMSELYLRRLQVLLASDAEPDAIREEFQRMLGTGISHALKATELDPRDYHNWVALGNVYQNVVPLGIEGAYEGAIQAFDRALELRPAGPNILLAKAALERLSGNSAQAKELAEQAVEARSQFTDAILLLAQLQIEEGDVDEAIRSVEAATLFDQNNPVGFFQLGLLRYSKGDYTGAAGALERAVTLNPVYANAQYFLGLSYYRIGGLNDRAIAQFERVLETNPGSTDVQSILENLRAGRPPYGEVAEPTPTEEIRTREELPLTEPVEPSVEQ